MWTSKLGNKYPMAWMQQHDQESQRELKKLRKLPGNEFCADCGRQDTSWSSVSLGVFICVTCSDVHRSVGTHITKVKGCTGTYLWGPDELEKMKEIGNSGAHKIYGRAMIAPTASKEEKQQFVVEKYDKRSFADSKIHVETSNIATSEETATPAQWESSLKGVSHQRQCSDQFVSKRRSTLLETIPSQTYVDAKVAQKNSVAKKVDIPDDLFDELFKDLEHIDGVTPAVSQCGELLSSANDIGLDAFLDMTLHAPPMQPAPKADPFFDIEWPVC
jgi:hypothetical protein